MTEIASIKQASQSEDQRGLSRVKFFYLQALDADEAGDKDNAVELYTKAVELSINTVNYKFWIVRITCEVLASIWFKFRVNIWILNQCDLTELLSVSQNKHTTDLKLQQKLTNLAKQALERAEVLKGIEAPSAIPNPPSPPNTPLPTDEVPSGLQSIPEKDDDVVPSVNGNEMYLYQSSLM